MKKNTSYFKKKLLTILTLVLAGYSITFLYFLIKLLFQWYKNRGQVKLDWTIGSHIIIDVAMVIFSAMFAYICFKIRKNLKE